MTSSRAGALGLHWMIDGRKDDTPPGSGLVFELWKNPRLNTYSVRVFYRAQTLEQMRNALPLTLKDPPWKVSVALPDCNRTDAECDISSFKRALESASENTERPHYRETPTATMNSSDR